MRIEEGRIRRDELFESRNFLIRIIYRYTSVVKDVIQILSSMDILLSWKYSHECAGWSKNFRAFFIRVLLAFTVINFNFRLIWNLNGKLYKGCYVYKRNPKGWRLVAVAPTKTVHQHLHFSNIIPESPTVYVTQPCALYLPEALQTKLPRRGYLYGFRRSTGAIDFFHSIPCGKISNGKTESRFIEPEWSSLPGGWESTTRNIFHFLACYTVWNI